jgi:N-acetylneuraminic acid mutarotase
VVGGSARSRALRQILVRMKKKSASQSAFFRLRTLIALLLCTAAAFSVLTLPLLAFLRPQEQVNGSQRTLSFEERVSYQKAIEEVYWRHRIWPKERPDPKPSLDAVMSDTQLEKKVTDYLRNSQALEDYWQRPLTAEQLQAEMDRMAKHTRRPEVLRELFEALGNDPFVIAECLARPALARRLLADWYAFDERIHGELRRGAQAELQAHLTVEQMKETSGAYRENEIARSDSTHEESQRGLERDVKLNSREWDETVQKLAAIFGQPRATEAFGMQRSRLVGNFESADMSVHSKTSTSGDFQSAAYRSASVAEAYEKIPIGKLSPLQEDETSYYATAVIEKIKGRLKLATVSWLKEPLESWQAGTESRMTRAIAAAGTYALPIVSSDTAGCAYNTWAATSMNAPHGRFYPTAVWTGSEMIVWGGYEFFANFCFNTGGRYNPSTDTWIATSNDNAPEPRTHHTAVWTGTEMIVWGGADTSGVLNTGGRYNPTTNTWTATSTANAPYYRDYHTAIWTGTQMIIWGGTDGYTLFNTGGRYNPSTNTWVSTSTANAPEGRQVHTAVWTGSEMIVWGGNAGGNIGNNLNSGGRYNPGTNMWAPTSTVNAPEARWFHTAIWAGGVMIVWGGAGNSADLNTGGGYNPLTDSWAATNTTNAPTPRDSHTAVWTGSEMIVWGGFAESGDTDTGGRYHPGTNSWTVVNTNNAPSAREVHTAIWTGSEMIVWGGGNADDNRGFSTGGRYNPTSNSWATTNGNAPTARSGHAAVWTGSEMIVWGGYDGSHSNPAGDTDTGARYNPSMDNWTATSTSNAPSVRQYHTAVWTGSEMIIWGGEFYPTPLNTGGRYNPIADSWIATSTTGVPAGRYLHTAVWTGSEMIVWGGYDGNFFLNTGARYNPASNSWVATNSADAPSSRYHHTAVWTGSEMIIWGGYDFSYLNTGGSYTPTSDSWAGTSTANAPEQRENHTAVWTGSEMIVWGGYNYPAGELNTGGIYSPVTNTWTATCTRYAPTGRHSHTAVWTGTEMIVWGGGDFLNSGGRYDPHSNSWWATSTTNAPTGRRAPTAVWTGSEMIVWGGKTFEPIPGFDTGGRYCAQPTSTPTPTPCTGRCAPTPRPRPTPAPRPCD